MERRPTEHERNLMKDHQERVTGGAPGAPTVLVAMGEGPWGLSHEERMKRLDEQESEIRRNRSAGDDEDSVDLGLFGF
ncbi:hypothetical protein KQI84_03120 [bacterium]|nr:hypothetical protein [bacterium]